jgi:hypothetical protein
MGLLKQFFQSSAAYGGGTQAIDEGAQRLMLLGVRPLEMIMASQVGRFLNADAYILCISVKGGRRVMGSRGGSKSVHKVAFLSFSDCDFQTPRRW